MDKEKFVQTAIKVIIYVVVAALFIIFAPTAC